MANLGLPRKEGDQYEWASFLDGDDSITLAEVCGDRVPWDLYISVTSYRGNPEYLLTATTDYGFSYYPLASLSLNQLPRSLQGTFF